MTNVSTHNGDPFPDADADGGAPGTADPTDPLPLVSAALSALGFLTLLRLADRRDRSPAKALGLFLATSLESTLGTALGFAAVKRSRKAEGLSRGLLLSATGIVLGVLTTVMNFNWMRTRRRL
jgi:hypothetical protein